MFWRSNLSVICVEKKLPRGSFDNCKIVLIFNTKIFDFNRQTMNFLSVISLGAFSLNIKNNAPFKCFVVKLEIQFFVARRHHYAIHAAIFKRRFPSSGSEEHVTFSSIQLLQLYQLQRNSLRIYFSVSATCLVCNTD